MPAANAARLPDTSSKPRIRSPTPCSPGLQVTADGVVLDPAADAPADRRTDAEKRAEAHMLKYEEARAKKAAAKSHQQRIKELNEKLASMTEHNDLFRISYTA